MSANSSRHALYVKAGSLHNQDDNSIAIRRFEQKLSKIDHSKSYNCTIFTAYLLITVYNYLLCLAEVTAGMIY